MSQTHRTLLVALLAGALPVFASATVHPDSQPAPEIAVVINVDNPLRKLAPLDLYAIYTGSQRRWADGSAMVAFNFPPDTNLRTLFDWAVLKMTPDEVARFWIDQRVRGAGRPPRQVPEPTLVARLVAKLPEGIGYLPADVAAGAGRELRVVARISGGRVIDP